MAKRRTLKIADAEIVELKEKLGIADIAKPFVIPDDITEPYAKLIYALSDLAGHIERLAEDDDTGGSGDFGYSFTSVFDMIDQVRPLLHERGLYMSGTMKLESDEHVRAKFMTSKQKEGTDLRIPIEWTIENYFGAEKTVTILGEARDTTDKSTGKAFTASQKIALRSLCGLSTGDPEDTEQDSIESTGASSERPAQGQQSGSRDSAPTELFGVCPIHDGAKFFPPTQKALDAGHSASHKVSDNEFCDYGEVRQGHESEVAPLIRQKFGEVDAYVIWAKALDIGWFRYIQKIGVGKFSAYRPQDWANLKIEFDEMSDAQQSLTEVAKEMAGETFCGEVVGSAEDGKPCRLVAGHPEDIEHSASPTLAEIEEAKAAVESLQELEPDA